MPSVCKRSQPFILRLDGINCFPITSTYYTHKSGVSKRISLKKRSHNLLQRGFFLLAFISESMPCLISKFIIRNCLVCEKCFFIKSCYYQQCVFIFAPAELHTCIICLIASACLFGCLGFSFAITGSCRKALLPRLYYYHSAGECLLVSGKSTVEQKSCCGFFHMWPSAYALKLETC